MELAFWIYLISLIDSINSLLNFILGASTIVFIFLSVGLFFFSSMEEDYSKIKKAFKKFLKFFKFITIPAILIGVLLPSSTTMYTMLGVVAGERLIQTNEVNVVLDKSYKLLTTKLDEAIQETQETNNE